MLRRILFGIGANALTQIAIAFIQLLAVPFLIQSWGVTRYGTWLMIFTLPSALVISDFGFSTSAGNDMTMKFARHDNDGVLRVYQSLWAFVFAVTAIFSIVAAVVAYMLPINWLVFTQVYDSDNIRLTFLLLTLYAMVALQGSVVLAGLRCSGNYASGTLVMAFVLFLEGIALISAAFLAQSFWIAGLALFCTRSAGVAALNVLLHKKVPWLVPGFSRASSVEIRRLVGPALAVTSLTLSDMINLQGMILIVGKMVSPAAVAVFSTARTLTRVGLLTTTMFNSTFLPEFSTAVSTNDECRKAQLIAANFFVVVAVAVVTFVGFGLYGREIIDLWTHGQIAAPLSVILLLTAASNLRSLWQSGAVILLSVNKHGRYAPSFLIVSIATMLVAIVLSQAFEVAGAAASIVGMEAVMLILVSRCIYDDRVVENKLVFQNIKNLPKHLLIRILG